MFKLLAVVVFSLLFDVQVVVSSKERKASHASVQDVQGSFSSEFHEGRGVHAPQESELVPDAGRDQALDALL